MHRPAAEAVLITGVYGSGKTAIVEEIGTVLEERGAPTPRWTWTGWGGSTRGWNDDAAEYQMMLKNLEGVVGNYRGINIALFVLALSIESQAELDAIKTVLSMPLTVARLAVSLETVEARLRSDATTGRLVDLRWTEVWLKDGRGVGLEDFVVPNDRPIRDVAMDILRLSTGSESDKWPARPPFAVRRRL